MALTEFADLEARLNRDPENVILGCMMVDELMEARGMLRTEAMNHVDHLRRMIRASLDIAAVAKVIAANGPRYEYLKGQIQLSLGQPTDAAYVLYLTGGEQRPRIGVSVDDLPIDTPGPGLYVTVGATWCRRWCDICGKPLHWPKLRRPNNRRVLRRPDQYRVIPKY